MKNFVACDPSGKVLLTVEAEDIAFVPTEHNGVALTVHELDKNAKESFDALSSRRSGTMFYGSKFSALPDQAADVAASKIP